MNINSYIRYFGNKTFEENPFNDVDALILAEFSYINMELLYPKGEDRVCLKDIDIKHLKKDIFYGSVDASYNKTLLKNMVQSVRFRDLIVTEVESRFSKEEINQFYALTIIFPNGDLYISFRGTDITLIGWKENFLITYQTTMLAQIQSVSYVERVLDKFPNSKFYLGGHSKGGNMAFYAALHIENEYADRMINAYSFDGPGFREGISHLETYESRIGRMIKYRTYNDVIGSFFNNMTEYKTVHSTGLLFGGHDTFFWQISPVSGKFIYAKDISYWSKTYSKRFMDWLESLSFDDRALATDALFEIFKGNNTVIDLAKNFGKDIVTSKKALSRYSNDEQKKLKTTIKKLFKYMMAFSSVSEKEPKKIESPKDKQ